MLVAGEVPGTWRRQLVRVRVWVVGFAQQDGKRRYGHTGGSSSPARSPAKDPAPGVGRRAAVAQSSARRPCREIERGESARGRRESGVNREKRDPLTYSAVRQRDIYVCVPWIRHPTARSKRRQNRALTSALVQRRGPDQWKRGGKRRED